MKRKTSTFQRRRKAYSIGLLTIFLMWLPLTAFSVACCCSSVQPSASSEMSCHQDENEADATNVDCHLSDSQPLTQNIKIPPTSCCSEQQFENILQLAVQQSTHQCQTDCSNNDLFEPSGIIASNQTAVKSITTSHLSLKHESRTALIGKLNSTGMCFSLLSYPPPLFLINSSFLI